jgi:hypothetical protein
VSERLLRDAGLESVDGAYIVYSPRESARLQGDHHVALTHLAVEEHLYAVGFSPRDSILPFLPHSFRGRLPASQRLTGIYLRVSTLRRVLGKQFLVFAER